MTYSREIPIFARNLSAKNLFKHFCREEFKLQFAGLYVKFDAIPKKLHEL